MLRGVCFVATGSSQHRSLGGRTRSTFRPETNSEFTAENMRGSKRKNIFQPSILRGKLAVSFREIFFCFFLIGIAPIHWIAWIQQHENCSSWNCVSRERALEPFWWIGTQVLPWAVLTTASGFQYQVSSSHLFSIHFSHTNQGLKRIFERTSIHFWRQFFKGSSTLPGTNAPEYGWLGGDPFLGKLSFQSSHHAASLGTWQLRPSKV